LDPESISLRYRYREMKIEGFSVSFTVPESGKDILTPRLLEWVVVYGEGT
jgi:hypothetical protein